MSYQRQLRENGEYISLGGVSYRIDGVEGLGGSSIVYKASYSDGLNTEHSHQVYIKELFPWHPKGYVYREKDGSIVGINDGSDLMKYSKQKFRQGNQINLLRFPEILTLLKLTAHIILFCLSTAEKIWKVFWSARVKALRFLKRQ